MTHQHAVADIVHDEPQLECAESDSRTSICVVSNTINCTPSHQFSTQNNVKPFRKLQCVPFICIIKLAGRTAISALFL